MGEETSEAVEEQTEQEYETRENSTNTTDSSNVTYNKIYQMAVSGNIDYDTMMEMAVKGDIDSEDYSELENVLEQAVQDGRITGSDASEFKQAMVSFTKDMKDFYGSEYNTFVQYARHHNKNIKNVESKEVTDEIPNAVAYTDTELTIGVNSRYDEMLDEMKGQYGNLDLTRESVAKYIIAHELAHTGQSYEDLNREPAPAAAEYDVEKFLSGYFQYRSENTQGEESKQYSGLASIAGHRAEILENAIEQYDSQNTYSDTVTYRNTSGYNPYNNDDNKPIRTDIIPFPNYNSLDELVMRNAA